LVTLRFALDPGEVMTRVANREPAHLGRSTFTDLVNAAAGLPFPLTVWTVVDVLDAPDQLRVTAGNTELAAMPFEEAERLGTVEIAAELGRRARAAYDAGVEPAECA
jgi:hypothetical protein